MLIWPGRDLNNLLIVSYQRNDGSRQRFMSLRCDVMCHILIVSWRDNEILSSCLTYLFPELIWITRRRVRQFVSTKLYNVRHTEWNTQVGRPTAERFLHVICATNYLLIIYWYKKQLSIGWKKMLTLWTYYKNILMIYMKKIRKNDIHVCHITLYHFEKGCKEAQSLWDLNKLFD